ncbi:probable eukaryotic translation initiation factor eif-3 [Phaffia rhodozyma]|uniref:Eukaryotic translation initiation factor 3 subunit A n=1 Tax=Phaffia rhodozyma TaxID=264483 RepID=A0A0F7SLV8_PHARH|nr:probable eukaryotic translation initiation factor eif-3 [Phaffia rhodozyma]
MAPYAKPETSLKRAEELLSLSPPKEKEALDALAEVFVSKRFKSTPITALEPVIIRFLELCVSMRKGKIAKEGLAAYRNVAQSTNVPSVENVIKRFLSAAEAKVAEAQESAASLLSTKDDSSAEEPEADLDAPLEPSTLLMMSVDAQKDRTDRQIVLPALRFYWECLRISLEVLRNSARLEIIYQQIVQRAFAFCIQHTRKTEFRRLCEIIRKDLATVHKYSHQQNTINLSEPDILARFLEIRFQQLNSAVDLELWQEAFRSVEDIQGLLVNPASKKALKPAMMINYYEKLTKVFKSEGGSMAVFHAAAWGRYQMFAERGAASAKEGQSGLSEEDAKKNVGFVLLSALAVPVTEDGEGKRHATKLVNLLNLPKMPTRAGLLKDALDRNILARTAPDLAKLYTLLEQDFHPLTICSTTAPIIQSLASSPDYAQYAAPIQHVVISRLFQQLSQVYDSVSMAHVLSLVSAFSMDEDALEKFIMAACKRAELAVRLDHVQKSILFLDEPFTMASSKVGSGPAAFTSNALIVDSKAGLLQPSTADLVRTQLSRLASVLHSTVQFLDPSIAVKAKEAQRELFAKAVAQAEAEQAAFSARRALVARRKELMDELSVRRATEEAAAKAEKARVAAIELKKKEEEDYKKMQRERIQQEVDQVRIDEARKLAESLKLRGGLKVDADKIDNMDTDGLVQLQVEQLEKEKREMAERLRIIGKRTDHIERAFRKEEIPLVHADYERQQADDLAAHQLLQQQTRDHAKAVHEEAVGLKNRLARILGDYQIVKSDIQKRQAGLFEERRKASGIKIAEEKEKLRARVLAERAERKRRAEEEDKKRAADEAAAAAAEERRQEDEARAAEEEKVRLEIEGRKQEAEEKARAAQREAREKQRQADAELVKAQMQREEEAMTRRNAAKASPAGAPPAPSSGAWKRPGAGSSSPSASSSPAPTGERRRLQLSSRSVPLASESSPAAAPASVVAPAAPLIPAVAMAAAATAASSPAAPTEDGFKEVPVRGQKWTRGVSKWANK